MIVCAQCGLSASSVGARCAHCHGRAVEQPTPAKALLSQTQGNRSPQTDRWSKSYTTSPGGSPRAATPPASFLRPSRIARSPLQRKASEHDVVDVQLDQESELARVYGSVLDPNFVFPECAACLKTFVPGEKQYEPRDLTPGNQSVLCRPCYSLTYSKGQCSGCDKPIVGDRHEGCGGRWIKGRNQGTGWHARCYVCVVCKASLYPLTDQSVLTADNHPCCISCSPQSARLLESPEMKSTGPDGHKSRSKYPLPMGRKRTNAASSEFQAVPYSENSQVATDSLPKEKHKP